MGPLETLVALPVWGPIGLVLWVAENVQEQAERQLYGQDALRGRLMELELSFDLGEIGEEEFLEEEAALLEALEAAQERDAQTMD